MRALPYATLKNATYLNFDANSKDFRVTCVENNDVITKTLFFSAVIASMITTLTSAWSAQFPGIFNAFSPPPQLPFRSFFQDAVLSPRYYVHPNHHQQPFRQSLSLYQQPPFTSVLPTFHLPTPPAHSVVQTTNVHHHHVFYYFYVPTSDGESQRTFRRGVPSGAGVQQRTRQHCDHQSDGPVYPSSPPADGPVFPSPPMADSPAYPSPPPTNGPVYLPPPPATTTTLPPTPPTPPPPSQVPCDDTIVVENVDYYPFSRTSMGAVKNSSEKTPSTVAATKRNAQPQQIHRSNDKSNFVLANYLLPPDK